jgi:hypothetical protein
VVAVEGQTDLFEVVSALHPVRRLAHFLHGGHQEANQDGDDGDHHQQLNEREPIPGPFPAKLVYHDSSPRGSSGVPVDEC